MKNIILVRIIFLLAITLLFSSTIFAQWTTSGSNIYRTSGNVGIGTTAPATTLHVSGATFFAGGGSGNSHIPWHDGNIILSPADKFFIRDKDNNFWAAFDAINKRLGIGTTSPNAALQLGNVLNNRRIVLWEDGN